MARRKQCRDLSDKKGQDTLMPVSPREQPTTEGLSYNGEAAESGKKSEIVDAVGQIDSFVLQSETGAMGEEKDG